MVWELWEPLYIIILFQSLPGPRKERKRKYSNLKGENYSGKHNNIWLFTSKNMPESLETPGISDCWLEGEWTELGGCCSDAEEIPLRLVDWTPSPIPDWEETDEPWELNCIHYIFLMYKKLCHTRSYRLYIIV